MRIAEQFDLAAVLSTLRYRIEEAYEIGLPTMLDERAMKEVQALRKIGVIDTCNEMRKEFREVLATCCVTSANRPGNLSPEEFGKIAMKFENWALPDLSIQFASVAYDYRCPRESPARHAR